MSQTPLPKENIIWAKVGDRIEHEKIKIQAFDGFYWAKDKKGCPSLGYFVNTGKKRILFTGDVRDFTPKNKPSFENVDCLFAHVWLGRGNAQNYPWTDYLEPYCKFMSSFYAKKIMLTHLYNTARSVDNMWIYTHDGIFLLCHNRPNQRNS